MKLYDRSCQPIYRFHGNYRWCSSFAPVTIRMGSDLYPSVEHAYQASKTIDPIERAWFRGSITAGQAKRLSNKVTLREGWHDIKESIMRELTRQKFKQPYYRELLIQTGEAYIEEGNYHGDIFWGVNLRTGIGDNKLGQILMQHRYEANHPPKKFAKLYIEPKPPSEESKQVSKSFFQTLFN